MVTDTRILIIGSTGMIGQKLRSVLSSKNNVFSTFNSKPFIDGFKVDVTSTSNLEKIFELSKPEIVINLSAIYNNLDFCEQNKKLVMAVNGDSLENISKLSNQYDSFLLHFSSDYVFDGEKGNYCESDIPNPINYFGVTKLKGEQNVQALAKNFCIVRTSMVYGKSPTKTLPDWILEQTKQNSSLKLISDQFMTPTYLENLSDMVIDLLDLKFSGLMHLAGSLKLSRFEFAKLLLKKLNIDQTLIEISMSDFDKNNLRSKDSSLNTSLANDKLNHKPESFEISLDKYLKEKNFL